MNMAKKYYNCQNDSHSISLRLHFAHHKTTIIELNLYSQERSRSLATMSLGNFPIQALRPSSPTQHPGPLTRKTFIRTLYRADVDFFQIKTPALHRPLELIRPGVFSVQIIRVDKTNGSRSDRLYITAANEFIARRLFATFISAVINSWSMRNRYKSA